jgi:hypothetical protein
MNATPDEAIAQWNSLVSTTKMDFIGILLITSLPMLGTVFLIVLLFAIISKIVTERRLYRKRKREKEAEHIESFMLLVIETKKERKKREEMLERDFFEEPPKRKSVTSTDSTATEDETRPKNYLFHNRSKHPYADFNLPDERKVPMVLVNDAIAKSNALNFAESVQSSSSPSSAEQHVGPNSVNSCSMSMSPENPIKIDPEVVELVNKLINPTMATLAPNLSRTLTHSVAALNESAESDGKSVKRVNSGKGKPRLSNSQSLEILNFRRKFAAIDENSENRSTHSKEVVATRDMSPKMFYLPTHSTTTDANNSSSDEQPRQRGRRLKKIQKTTTPPVSTSQHRIQIIVNSPSGTQLEDGEWKEAAGDTTPRQDEKDKVPADVVFVEREGEKMSKVQGSKSRIYQKSRAANLARRDSESSTNSEQSRHFQQP